MRILLTLFRSLLSLRYRVVLRNAGLLSKPGPLLLLSNHEALVDPQILVSHVYRFRPISPVVTEAFYNIPLLTPLFRLLRTIPVPDVQSSHHTRNEGALLVECINGALQAGQSILLYPSGQLAGQGREAIFGKQSAFHIVRGLSSQPRILTVTIRGLWGSMWSKAWYGTTPSFFRTCLKAILFIIANGIFFLPRRTVTLTIHDVTEEAKRASERTLQEFNAFLEESFNQEGEESVLYLKHLFYVPALRRSLPEEIEGSRVEMQRTSAVSGGMVDPDVLAFVRKKILQMKHLDALPVTPSTHLVLDTQFDSLDLAEIVTVLQKEYPHAGNPPLSRLKTVGDLCLMAEGKIREEAALPSCRFDRDCVESDLLQVDRRRGILQQFLDTFTRKKGRTFSFDAHLGSLSRRQFLLRAIVASFLLRKLNPPEHVGIMLPALQSTTLLIGATSLAGKTPVFFNWTMGEKALRHCMESVHVEKILTVRPFFETVRDQIPSDVHDRFLFLDQELQRVTFLMKMRGMLAALFPRLVFGNVHTPKHAVILFTSGSEALPKTVPLTEQNLLADLAGTLQIFSIDSSERVLGFLPPFHSFGFTLTCLLPLLTGLRTAYTPNPTDPRACLRMVKHTKATLLPTTPTFLKLMLALARPSDLLSLHTVVSGAEACPEDVRGLLAMLAPPSIRLLEGYGITECSPVVTITPPDRPKKGSVGVFIGGSRGCVTAIDSLDMLRAGAQGMIHCSGDHVFDGYLDPRLVSPFVIIEGKRFYRTGDLGYIDADGYLFITGRLKRFIKLGGEMISLPFVETILLRKFGDPKETVLALEGSDAVDPPRLVLFTTREVSVQDVNVYLRTQGVSALVKIHDVQRIPAIPVLGTGKIDYKVLKQQIH